MCVGLEDVGAPARCAGRTLRCIAHLDLRERETYAFDELRAIRFGLERSHADVFEFDLEVHERRLAGLANDQLRLIDHLTVTEKIHEGRRGKIDALDDIELGDPGHSGPTRFFCNNNGGMRREVWLRHPLPVVGGPYASRLQTEAIWRAGGRFRFEPRMRLVHDYEGWGMERDIRSHHGFSTVIIRRMDGAIPHAWLVRLGYAGIPLIVAATTFDSWRDCVRCAHHYRVRWYELPVAMALSVVLHLMEIPGMIRAFRGQPITRTRYR